jgi:hypothetical protein
MNKHTAICPNGQIVKRNSANCSYSHVTVVFNIKTEQWTVLGWSSTFELARQNCKSHKTHFDKLIHKDYYTGVFGDNPECLILKTNIA